MVVLSAVTLVEKPTYNWRVLDLHFLIMNHPKSEGHFPRHLLPQFWEVHAGHQIRVAGKPTRKRLALGESSNFARVFFFFIKPLLIYG